jgi:hypothetical protein
LEKRFASIPKVRKRTFRKKKVWTDQSTLLGAAGVESRKVLYRFGTIEEQYVWCKGAGRNRPGKAVLV